MPANPATRGLAGRALCAALFVLMLWPAMAARAADPIRIAFIGPFSGAFAPQGDAFLSSFNTLWTWSTTAAARWGARSKS